MNLKNIMQMLSNRIAMNLKPNIYILSIRIHIRPYQTEKNNKNNPAIFKQPNHDTKLTPIIQKRTHTLDTHTHTHIDCPRNRLDMTTKIMTSKIRHFHTVLRCRLDFPDVRTFFR